LLLELRRYNIHVSVICPGGTRTRVLAHARLELPSRFAAWLEQALARWAPDPDSVAQEIVEAVRSEKSLVMTGVDLLPLWALRRLSIPLYHRVAATLTSLAYAAFSARGREERGELAECQRMRPAQPTPESQPEPQARPQP